jgi:autotransporter-associated beta strand protein
LQVTGNSLLTLTGSNGYTGGTIIGGGTVQAINPYALGPVPASLAVNAGTLDVARK